MSGRILTQWGLFKVNYYKKILPDYKLLFFAGEGGVESLRLLGKGRMDGAYL